MRLDRFVLGWGSVIAFLGCPLRAQTTTRLSVGTGGGQADSFSGADHDATGFILLGMSLSSDGRYLAFASNADDLVPGDTNGTPDVFVRDRQLGTTTRVSVGPGGVEANGMSLYPSLSSDGRYVAFWSLASNLVAGDTNGVGDVFVRDLQTGSTTQASVSSAGVQGNCGDYSYPILSQDGRYVVFLSCASNLVPGDTNGVIDVFVRDLQNGTTTRVSVDSSGVQGNADSGIYGWPSISADGRFVSFDSSATNLVSGDTNGWVDLFVHDRTTGATTRESVSSSGIQGNAGSFESSLSPDGRYLAFASQASNFYAGDSGLSSDVFLRDRQSGTTTLLFAGSADPMFSADGNHLEFDSDVPGQTFRTFVGDLQTGAVTQVSVSSAGIPANDHSAGLPGAISSDGRFVAFASGATNLVSADTNGAWDVFLHDVQTGATTRESVQGAGVQGEGTSYDPAMSDDGRYVVFASAAANLLPGDLNNRADVFLRDLATGTLTLVSLSSSGAQANQTCDTAQVSSDGRYVAFFSISTNLVPNDSNGTGDVFVRDLQAGTTVLASLDSNGAQGVNAMPGTPISMSSDGRYVTFCSPSPFVPGDTNGALDVFVRDLQAGTTTRASEGSSNVQGNGDSYGGSLSADGRYAAFDSAATNLVGGDTNGASDVFVRDLQAGTTVRASVGSGGAQGDGDSLGGALSPDGRYVAFTSYADNLVAGDTNGSPDVFVRDLQAGTTTRESVDSNGGQSNGSSTSPAISRDGRFVMFVSDATNLVPGGGNGVQQVYVRDRLTGRTTRQSASTSGVQGNDRSSPFTVPAISADGRLVAFDSLASNLVSDDTNGASDVFLRDRTSEATFAPFCFGDGTGAACPCGNSGLPGHGCENSSSTGGALLTATGAPSLSADSVVFTATGEKPTATSVLLSGHFIVSPANYGDGLRCINGTLKRLYTHAAVGGAVSMPQGTDPTVSARSAAVGDPILTGSTRLYQIFYRDPSATFCPSPAGSTFNVTNALAVAWGP